MRDELIRIGTDKLANESRLNTVFDLVFGSSHKFVYIHDYTPVLYVNRTWTGVFSHLMNDRL